MAFGAHSLIKDLLGHEEARVVLERHLPGVSSHPRLPEVMYMTLGEVASFPEAGISQQRLQAIVEDLGRIGTRD